MHQQSSLLFLQPPCRNNRIGHNKLGKKTTMRVFPYCVKELAVTLQILPQSTNKTTNSPTAAAFLPSAICQFLMRSIIDFNRARACVCLMTWFYVIDRSVYTIIKFWAIGSVQCMIERRRNCPLRGIKSYVMLCQQVFVDCANAESPTEGTQE